MPPRHGKSELISRYFPAWYLCRYPERRVMLGCHEGTLAGAYGRKAREVMREAGPLFGLRVDLSSHAANHWNLRGCEGGMDTAGVGGTFTGRGAHVFIVDDPVKNSEEALSQAHRDKVWELFVSTIETRLEPGGSCVVVQTRWNEDDLAGRISKQIKEGIRKGWDIVSFSALAREGDPLGRKPGEALWPERYPRKYLLELRSRWDHDEARIGPYWWSALYDQEPAPRAGGLFKRVWFRYFEEDKEHYRLHYPGQVKTFEKNKCFKFMTCDLAVSTKSSADFFVLQVWAVTPERQLLLLDMYRERLEAPDQQNLITATYHRYRPLSYIAVESVAYQLSMVQILLRCGIPAKESRVDRDKVARAQTSSTLFSAGRIFFPKSQAWLTEYEKELLVFPNGKYDDMVDATSIASNELLTAGGAIIA